MTYAQATRYPVLRAVLHEDFDQFDDQLFANQLTYFWPDMSADDLELNMGNIGRQLSRGMSQAGNVFSRAAPGMLAGAGTGASMGAALGPYGMLAGAALGAIAGGVSSYRSSGRSQQPQPRQTAAGGARPTPRPMPQPPQQPRPVPRPAPGFAPPPITGGHMMPPPVVQGGAPANNSQALLQLLARPEVINAILALAMGRLGRQQVPVGQQLVPAVTIAGAAGVNPSPNSPQPGTNEEALADQWSDWVLSEMAQNSPEDHPFQQALEVEISGLQMTAETQHPSAWTPNSPAYPQWHS